MKQLDSEKRYFKGIFSYKIFNKAGELIEEYEDKNLIVDRARYNMARLISGAGNSIYITNIGFGIGTGAPSTSDTVLTSPFIKAISAVTYADGVSVSFGWTLELTENNGVAITEFGLFSYNGDLFARKTRAAINKANDFRIEGTWTIVF